MAETTWLQCVIPTPEWEFINKRRQALGMKWPALILPGVKAELDKLEADAKANPKQTEATPKTEKGANKKATAKKEVILKGKALADGKKQGKGKSTGDQKKTDSVEAKGKSEDESKGKDKGKKPATDAADTGQPPTDLQELANIK